MQLGLRVKVLPRIPRVAGGARRRGGGFAGEAFGRRGGWLVAERDVFPLPRRLAVCLGQLSRGIQMVAVDGVRFTLDHRSNRHGA